jgi:hypothetical protein
MVPPPQAGQPVPQVPQVPQQQPPVQYAPVLVYPRNPAAAQQPVPQQPLPQQPQAPVAPVQMTVQSVQQMPVFVPAVQQMQQQASVPAIQQMPVPVQPVQQQVPVQQVSVQPIQQQQQQPVQQQQVQAATPVAKPASAVAAAVQPAISYPVPKAPHTTTLSHSDVQALKSRRRLSTQKKLTSAPTPVVAPEKKKPAPVPVVADKVEKKKQQVSMLVSSEKGMKGQHGNENALIDSVIALDDEVE